MRIATVIDTLHEHGYSVGRISHAGTARRWFVPVFTRHQGAPTGPDIYTLHANLVGNARQIARTLDDLCPDRWES